MQSPGAKAGSNRRKKILVIDDEQVILDLLRRVLSREGYHVTATRRGEEALGLVSTESFDLAIADVGARRLDGRRLMRMIVEASPHTAVVVMTGYPADEVNRFAREHAQGYLEKPFTLEDLLMAVRSALDGRTAYHGEARAVSSPCCRKGCKDE